MEQYLVIEEVVDQAVIRALTAVRMERSEAIESLTGVEPLSSGVSGTFHIQFAPERKNTLGSVCEYLRAEAIRLQTISEEVTSMLPRLAKLACPPTLRQRVERSARSLEGHLERLLAWTGEARRATSLVTEDESVDLFFFAREYLVKRCVWDTYLAARLALQGRFATDPEARDALSIVARDFLVSARLDWELWDWCVSQLSPSRARALREAQAGVSESLREGFVCAPTESHLAVGLPSQKACESLLDVLAAELWEGAFSSNSLAS